MAGALKRSSLFMMPVRKETACHHAQRDVVQRVFPAFWGRGAPPAAGSLRARARRKLAYLEEPGWSSKPLLPVMVDFRYFASNRQENCPPPSKWEYKRRP